MSVYIKHCAAWVAFMALGFLFGILALYASSWFVVPFFGVVLGMWWVLKRISCSVCATPVGDPIEYAGEAMHAGLVRKHCQRCGHELRSTAPTQ